MMATNTQQNSKKQVYTMQLASSVNIQLLAKQAGSVATNDDISVVRVGSGPAKTNAMPVLHEQPSEDGNKAMPVFRTQASSNGQKSMPISAKQQSPKGIKTMSVFRHQHTTANGPTSTPVFAVAQSSVDRRAPSPIVTSVMTSAPKRVSTSSTSSSEGGVTVVAVNITGHKHDVTKAVEVTSNGSALPEKVHLSAAVTSQPPVSTPEPAPPVMVSEPAPPVVVRQPAPPVVVRQPAPPVVVPPPAPPVVVPQSPPSPPPATTPDPLSPPPPPPPPLPPGDKPTRIQLSRSVSLTRSPSSAEALRSSRPSPSTPNTDVNPFFRPIPSRHDPFSFSLMIKDGRRKLSNEAFRTSKFVKNSSGSGSGSIGNSGCSNSNADKSPLSASLDRRITDSANGASLPDSTTSHSLPDIDGSSDSVFSDKSSETSNTSSIDATLTESPGRRCVRAVLILRRDLTVMLKVSCKTEQTASDQRLQALLCQIAIPCLEHFKKEKVQQLDLTAPNIMKLSLEGKPVKEHVAALSRDLGEDIIVSEAVCRKSTKKQYIGTSMNDIVYKEGNCQVAKSGVVVMLTKKNKLAPIQEFVDQLCRHVHVTKPTSLGSADNVVLGRRPQRHERINRTELLSQPFTYDLIISVAEAAHRSFVEINNFALYE